MECIKRLIETVQKRIQCSFKNKQDTLFQQQCQVLVERPNPCFCLTSCGGTSKVTVRRSTFRIMSRQGTVKKRPGPLAPPGRIRPSRNSTARSYSAITWRD